MITLSSISTNTEKKNSFENKYKTLGLSISTNEKLLAKTNVNLGKIVDSGKKSISMKINLISKGIVATHPLNKKEIDSFYYDGNLFEVSFVVEENKSKEKTLEKDEILNLVLSENFNSSQSTKDFILNVLLNKENSHVSLMKKLNEHVNKIKNGKKTTIKDFIK